MPQELTRDPQLLKGVLPMLALALLDEQESYGYELVTRLREAGLVAIAPATVYPVLTRLERDGRLTSRLVPSSAGPARKYYRPTDEGRAALKAAHSAWASLTNVVDAIMTTEE